MMLGIGRKAIDMQKSKPRAIRSFANIYPALVVLGGMIGSVSVVHADALSENCPTGTFGEECSQCVIYVDGDKGDDAAPGDAWWNAVATIEEGIARASASGCDVWVAKGFYTPSQSPSGRSFEMVPGVDLYGGFMGWEWDPTQRKIDANPSILSGEDIEGEPHADHVVIGANDVIFDGFTVQYGAAVVFAPAYPISYGGGMFIENRSMAIRNCVFFDNTAGAEGGAMSLVGGADVIISNTLFEENSATYGGAIGVSGGSRVYIANSSFKGGSSFEGGGVFVDGPESEAVIVNTVFDDVFGVYGASAVHVYDGRAALIQSVVVNNEMSSLDATVATFDGHLDVINSVFWGNQRYSDFYETCADTDVCGFGSASGTIAFSSTTEACSPAVGLACGSGNVSGDPQFVNFEAGNYRPRYDSPLKDGGLVDALPMDAADLDGDGNTNEFVPLDIFDKPRVRGASVDIGAYELQ